MLSRYMGAKRTSGTAKLCTILTAVSLCLNVFRLDVIEDDVSVGACKITIKTSPITTCHIFLHFRFYFTLKNSYQSQITRDYRL